MKRIKLPQAKELNIGEQLKSLYRTTHFEVMAQQADKVCHLMYCPTDEDDTPIQCNKCVGSIKLKEVRLINPKLTKNNLEKTLKIWEVLVK